MLNLYPSLLGLFICGFLLTIIGVFRYKRHRKQEWLAQLEYERNAFRLSRLRVEMQDRATEKENVARSLHNNVVALLLTAKERLYSLGAGGADSRQQKFINTIQLLGILSEDVRLVAHRLMPDKLNKKDLEAAFQAYC